MTRPDVLPLSCPPRGLSRVEAAAYVCVSPSFFDRMIEEGAMPKPKRILNTRVMVWDRLALDAAFAALPDGEEAVENPWHRNRGASA